MKTLWASNASGRTHARAGAQRAKRGAMMKAAGVKAILGIDAAWTAHEPSGVALIVRDNKRWRCRVVAPSYEAFIAACEGVRIDWKDGRFTGPIPDINQLCNAAAKAAGVARLNIIAVDMPLSHDPIAARRCADNAVSRRYGGRGCGTHTPNATRPGRISDDLRAKMYEAGYPLATKVAGPDTLTSSALIEVYPHPALLHLLRRDYRVPYKVSKAGKYWPRPATIAQRRKHLLAEFKAIRRALAKSIDGICLMLPPVRQNKPLTHLKRYEDALDALICCWVGSQVLDGRATAYGDAAAAIWIPNDLGGDPSFPGESS